MVKELRRYQGVVSINDWGGLEVEEIHDKGAINGIISVLDRYGSEGAISMPEEVEWRSNPPAQWGRDKKNYEDLAMSIAQSFEEIVFPHFMAGRKHWKDIDPEALVIYTLHA